METVLQEWAQGLVGDKTFQQISEEFAAIRASSRVWEREGHKAFAGGREAVGFA